MMTSYKSYMKSLFKRSQPSWHPGQMQAAEISFWQTFKRLQRKSSPQAKQSLFHGKALTALVLKQFPGGTWYNCFFSQIMNALKFFKTMSCPLKDLNEIKSPESAMGYGAYHVGLRSKTQTVPANYSKKLSSRMLFLPRMLIDLAKFSAERRSDMF